MSIVDSMSLRQSSAHALQHGRAVEVAAADRVCQEPSCSTRLSRYNPSPSCARHEGWSDPPATRRRRTRSG